VETVERAVKTVGERWSTRAKAMPQIAENSKLLTGSNVSKWAHLILSCISNPKEDQVVGLFGTINEGNLLAKCITLVSAPSSAFRVSIRKEGAQRSIRTLTRM